MNEREIDSGAPQPGPMPGPPETMAKLLSFEIGLTEGQVHAIGLVTAHWGGLEAMSNSTLLLLEQQPEVKAFSLHRKTARTMVDKLAAWSELVSMLALPAAQKAAFEAVRQKIAGSGSAVHK